MNFNIEGLRAWIGRSSQTEDVVTPRLVQEYRATFDPHLAAVSGDEAPLGLHWCLGPAIAPLAELGSDGHPARGGFLPPVPLPRRMWAAGEVETFAPLRIGDVVTKIGRIEDVTLKQGRTGPLCFVAVHYRYETPRGLAISERHDIVYRGAGAGGSGSKPPADPGPEPDLTWDVAASPILLFRYSAMTFNGHRIHYDLPYATGEEGYPGLVVHGPIQATLLINMAATLAGRVPGRFRYRGLSPLIAGPDFSVAGSRGADGAIALWTASADGAPCMAGDVPPGALLEARPHE